jgi:hypothetical protein
VRADGRTVFKQEARMRGLVPIGIALVVAWVLGFVVFKLAGFLIHLLVVIGVIMLIAGLVRRAGRDI